MLPGPKPRHSFKWVMQDVSFAVQLGEAVASSLSRAQEKNCLLKMIIGSTKPSTGNVRIAGCVAELLELGMGFQPNVIGRQNAFMAGQLLGYRVEDIACLMPDIEAFAETGD